MKKSNALKNVRIYLLSLLLASSFHYPITKILAQDRSFNYWVYAGKDSIEVVAAILDGSDTLPLLKIWEDDMKILGVRSSENGRILLLTIQNSQEKSLWTFFRENNTRHQLAVFPTGTSIPYGDISKDGGWVVFTGMHQDRTESWLMSSDGTSTRALGANLVGSYARAPNISWDSQSIAYVYGSDRILYIEDILSGKTTQITQAELGPVWNPWFLPGDNELFAMITPYRQSMKLYKIHLGSRQTELLWSTDEAVVGAIQSRINGVIALMSIPPDGKSWKIWGMKTPSSEPFLIAVQDRSANSFSLQLSFDGVWLLYRCDGNAIRVATMDGKTEASLHSHLGFQNVSFASFYTQDPFPVELKGHKTDQQQNTLEWSAKLKGSLPLAGFQLFRKGTRTNDSWQVLIHLPPESYKFLDATLTHSQETMYYRMRALDVEGNTSFWSNEVLIDRTPPFLEVSDPPAKTWLNTSPKTISGTVKDSESGIKTLRCNDSELGFSENGTFFVPLTPSEGKISYHFIATDHAENFTELSHELWIDTQAPQITITSHQNDEELKTGIVSLNGYAVDLTSGITEFSINGKRVSFNAEGYFNYSVEIKKGPNSFIFYALDKAGNSLRDELILMGLLPVSIQCWIGSMDITINGLASKIDAAPYIHLSSNRTMVPVRFMVEPIDSTIDFDPNTQVITIKRYRTTIICQIGKPTALVNGIEKPIDPEDPTLSPLIKESRTYLPLRFVAENLGFKVSWNQEKQQIDLYFPSF
jgi:hypothetical protein